MLLAGLCGAASAADLAAEGIDCAHPQGTMESDLCASDRTAEADAELNTTYAQVRQELHDQAASKACTHCDSAATQLVAAQRAWIMLRDQDCKAVYAFNADGTSRNGAEQHCLLTHTRDRTRQLRDFYELL
jgi:uncharacterized protein YecT (DUF1311 family)